MSATYNKINSFVAALANKVHNLGADQLVYALCAAANAPTATTTKLADLTQASYTHLSSRNVTTTSCTQTSGLCKLILADLVLTASGGSVGPFRYPVLYNSTATNAEALGYYDYGSDLTLADGEAFTIDHDGTNGVLQLQ